MFVTLETRPDELRSEAAQFGWDLRELEQKQALTIIDAASGKAGLPTSEKYALRRGFDMSTLAEEIYRVMKPGAEFLSLDFDKKFFKRWDPLKKWSMPHPYKTMYTQEEFKSHLEFLGMVVTFHNPDFSPAAKMNYFVIIAKK